MVWLSYWQYTRSFFLVLSCWTLAWQVGVRGNRLRQSNFWIFRSDFYYCQLVQNKTKLRTRETDRTQTVLDAKLILENQFDRHCLMDVCFLKSQNRTDFATTYGRRLGVMYHGNIYCTFLIRELDWKIVVKSTLIYMENVYVSFLTFYYLSIILVKT